MEMETSRREEIISRLTTSIAHAFEPNDEEPVLTMWGLISRYNAEFGNPELIGGAWVREHVPELADLT